MRIQCDDQQITFKENEETTIVQVVLDFKCFDFFKSFREGKNREMNTQLDDQFV